MSSSYMSQKVFAFKWWILLACLCGTLTICAGVGLMFTSAYLISCAALLPPISALSLSIVGVRFFGLSRGVFRYCERLIAHKVTFYLSSELRLWFYRCLEPIAPAGMKNHKSGDLLKRLMTDIETLELVFSRTVVPSVASLFVGVVMVFIMWSFDSSLVLPFSCGYLFAGLCIPGFIAFICWRLGQKIADCKSDIYLATVDAVQGMADLMAFNQFDEHERLLEEKSQRLISLQKIQNFVSGVSEPLQTVVMMITAITCFILSMDLVEQGVFAPVYLAVTTLGILASFEGVASLPQVFLFFSEIKVAYEDISDVVSVAVPVRGSSELCTLNSIEFKDVTFDYGEGGTVLDGASLLFEKGKSYAVVGASGAGKSSLINLIFGFWKPSEGEIYFDGVDSLSIDSYSVPEYVSVSPQRPFLFNDSIRNNFVKFHPEITDDEILGALSFASIDDAVVDGKVLSRESRGEGGNMLSGGELRRVSLALSIAGSSDFIIWDEPGSGLDSERYSDLLVKAREMSHNKGVVIITHKISGLESVDVIYVLQQGKVVEVGSYNELIECNGYFARIADQQSKALFFDP